MRDHAEVMAAERQLLSFFCQKVSRLPASNLVWQRASVYAWREAQHEAIYSALSALKQAPPASLRMQLLSRLTRLGFPDVACDDLFQASNLTPEQALQVIIDLAQGSSRPEGPEYE